MSDSLSLIPKEAFELLKLVYEDVARPGVSQVGQALARTVQFVTLPTLAFDWVNRRATIALATNLESYRKRLESRPQEQLCQVPPEIGVEILSKLSYVTDADIADYYLNLLEKASLRTHEHLGHPRFVSMISSISPDEARLLRWIKKQGDWIPWFRVRAIESPASSAYERGQHLHVWVNDPETFPDPRTEVALVFKDNFNRYIENLISLGIILVEEQPDLVAKNPFDTLFGKKTKLVDLLNERAKADAGNAITKYVPVVGCYWTTSIGKMFLDVCCSKVDA